MGLRKFLYQLARHYRPSGPALSLMRIAVAIVLIVDLIIRCGDLEAHYTDHGVWPVKLIGYGWKAGYWSFHAINGGIGWQATLMVLHFIAALFLLAGWHTVRAGFVAWLLLVSLHNRNVFILQSGDDLLRITLFLGIFLPWHSHFSVDNKTGRQGMPSSVFSFIAYLLLIASVYFFTVLLKSSDEWRSQGSAVYYALSLEQLRLPYSGDFVYRFPQLMKGLTWLVMGLEAFIPLLVLWPSVKGRTRTIAFLFIVILHSGIALTLYVGLFPLIAIATAIGLLPLSPGNFSRSPALHPFSARPERITLAFFMVAVAGVCLMLNLGSLPAFSYELRHELRKPAHTLRLDQYWGMFSPTILKHDGWFVYHGVDENGKEWDLRHNVPHVDYKKPERILSLYENDRWRKLAENLQNDRHTYLRPLYAAYILRKWNLDHPEKKMRYLHFYYMKKTNLPDYKTAGITKELYCVSDG